MIQIQKPKEVPDILQNKGNELTNFLCQKYEECPEDYQTGRQFFEFDNEVYGHKSVKNLLLQAQHHKCCFCESRITHIDYGDVEHFRPKAGYKQNNNQKPITKPGYYWLAYEWDNLLVSCTICNQKYKKNFFPLFNPTTRAISHTHNISQELPLLINPYIDNPENYISFNEEVPFAIDDNQRGKTTITYLGLDREKLNEERKEQYAMIQTIYQLFQMNDCFKLVEPEPDPQNQELITIINNLQNLIQDFTKSSKPYSAMFRAAIKKLSARTKDIPPNTLE